MLRLSRRGFLTHALGGATLLAGGWALPGFLSRTACAAAAALQSGPATRGGADETILVVVQLSGGNDGLNTVIPFRDDAYHRARPTLRVAPERVLRLSDTLGLHPDMTGFKRLYDEGLLSVVTDVGYPNPDRSHFRSMDIWHAAHARPEEVKDGWLGRLVDAHGAERAAPLALQLDGGPLPLALRTQRLAMPSITSLDAFRLPAGAEAIEEAIAAPRGNASAASATGAAMDDLLFVQRLAVSSCATARHIEEVAREHRRADAPAYPAYGLAERLRQIAMLIGADFGARIYYTSLNGFDTHARQALAHGPLLREFSESLAAFMDDMCQRGLSDRMLVMTFSEFGRRVKENGSQGTDHGAAAPMFVLGGACRAGVIGGAPDLSNLDDGDVRHRVDFRQVYAAVLRDWLRVDDRAVLAGAYEAVPVLRG